MLFSMYTVYEKPTDYPEHWVVRRQTITPNNVAHCELVMQCKSYKEICERRSREYPDVYVIPRDINDAPQIKEVWV